LLTERRWSCAHVTVRVGLLAKRGFGGSPWRNQKGEPKGVRIDSDHSEAWRIFARQICFFGRPAIASTADLSGKLRRHTWAAADTWQGCGFEQFISYRLIALTKFLTFF
jgi:hypothetical protein